jgi:hypothetical protein
MDAKTLADAITGSEYPFRLPRSLRDDAKQNRLVVTYSASDDLLEFEGAINDEIGAYGGTKARVDSFGIVPTYDDAKERGEAAMADYFKRKNGGAIIHAVWAPEGQDISWHIKTEIPHAEFTIMEDGETFCRGIVFSLSDIPT